MRLKFLHLHLHGLIRSKNLELGRDADTGGQTKSVLELVKSLANTSEVDQVDLVTRFIKDSTVDDEYSQEEEFVVPQTNCIICNSATVIHSSERDSPRVSITG